MSWQSVTDATGLAGGATLRAHDGDAAALVRHPSDQPTTPADFHADHAAAFAAAA